MSINPITEEATGWFFYTRRIVPKEWELNALANIDTVFINDYHDQQEKSKLKPKH